MSRLQMPASDRSHQNSFLLSSPIGFFIGEIKNGSLLSLRWQPKKPTDPLQTSELGQFIQHSLEGYFIGKKTTWDFTYRLPGSPEEQQVYIALMKIPYGETLTYGDLARWLHKPRAARWVGHVLAKNPLPVIIPCHRVVRKDKIGEYSAGGSEAKRWLIQWEKQQAFAGHRPPS